MNNPDFLKAIFGYLLLVIMAVTIGLIITGRVDEQHSYGLHEVLGILAVIAGMFGNNWFARAPAAPEEQKK